MLMHVFNGVSSSHFIIETLCLTILTDDFSSLPFILWLESLLSPKSTIVPIVRDREESHHGIRRQSIVSIHFYTSSFSRIPLECVVWVFNLSDRVCTFWIITSSMDLRKMTIFTVRCYYYIIFIIIIFLSSFSFYLFFLKICKKPSSSASYINKSNRMKECNHNQCAFFLSER